MTADFLHTLALSSIAGVGPALLRQLLSRYGTAEGVFARIADDAPGASPSLRALADAIVAGRAGALDFANRQVEAAGRDGVRMLCVGGEGYPARLAQCHDAPPVLFVRGGVNFETAKVLSVVGTRHPSDEGRDLCGSIVADLCRRHPDLIIVSGLAFGIDIAAHRAALRSGRLTVGVVAHGLDTLYPAQHRDEARRMESEGGAVVSEFAYGVRPEAYNFVARNRVIAGLADATLVVETAARGGSLITTRCAFDYDRQVLAVPGFPGRELSRGCNDLIRRNVAALVETADDVDAAMAWDVPAAVRQAHSAQPSLFASPQGAEQEAIVAALRAEDGLTASLIGQRARLPIATVNVELLNMEFAGLVKSMPGNSYRLLI